MITEQHRVIARRFDGQYFDGDRLTGYGGYAYHPRFWTDTVRRSPDYNRHPDDAWLLVVRCAKRIIMHDFNLFMFTAIYAVSISRSTLKRRDRGDESVYPRRQRL